MNISLETIQELETMYKILFYDDFINVVSVDKATCIQVVYDNEFNYIGKTIKATKKEMTLEYILTKLNSDKVYKSLSENFNGLLRKEGISAYPTTYGIGVFVAVGFRSNINSIKEKVHNLLKSIELNYTTETSDAGWVFRFKISKSAENVERINKYLK